MKDMPRFNLGIEMLFVSRLSFRIAPPSAYQSFNLGIEMLFVSSRGAARGMATLPCFNLGIEMLFVSSPILCRIGFLYNFNVSISESRCFSFQGITRQAAANRLQVSISESRCFSFQVITIDSSIRAKSCFNLGIEMLFVSRVTSSGWEGGAVDMFQSRNRDAFRFKSAQTTSLISTTTSSFNLGIEMLFVSSRKLTLPL